MDRRARKLGSLALAIRPSPESLSHTVIPPACSDAMDLNHPPCSVFFTVLLNHFNVYS